MGENLQKFRSELSPFPRLSKLDISAHFKVSSILRKKKLGSSLRTTHKGNLVYAAECGAKRSNVYAGESEH